MMRTSIVWLVLALLLHVTSPAAVVAPPEILLSLFGSGNSYDGDVAHAIQHYLPGPGNPTDYRASQAVRFTATGSDDLLHSTRLCRRNTLDPAPTFTIAASDAGGGPGATLAPKVVLGFIPVETPFVTETARPILIGWIASRPNKIGATPASGHAYGDLSAWNAFNTASLLAMLATPVPVPTTGAFVGVGVASLVARGSLQRKQ